MDDEQLKQKQKEILNEVLKTQAVQDVQTLEELENLFEEFGTVIGSHKEYDADKLKFKIAQLREMIKTTPFDDVLWNVITRTHGIRAKCMELFYYEKHEI
jgi:hypothetical protein